MEGWDGSKLENNTTCADLDQKCLQVPGMLTPSGCDTTFYAYGNGNVTVLNIMISGNYQGVTTLGDVGTTHTELMKAAMSFIVAFYSQPPEHTWNLLGTIFSQRIKEILKRWLYNSLIMLSGPRRQPI